MAFMLRVRSRIRISSLRMLRISIVLGNVLVRLGFAAQDAGAHAFSTPAPNTVSKPHQTQTSTHSVTVTPTVWCFVFCHLVLGYSPSSNASASENTTVSKGPFLMTAVGHIAVLAALLFRMNGRLWSERMRSGGSRGLGVVR